MNLHSDIERFSNAVSVTAEHFHISPAFIEKDYWITRALQRMSRNANADKVVFKGGTSLSKAYNLTNRFSEDIDIAVIDAESFTGNQLKMLIKRLAKDMADGLEEKNMPGVTSKGSRFYKAVYSYPNIVGAISQAVKTGQLLIEINTYANPYPYVQCRISSLVADYLIATNRISIIEQYDLAPFEVNVLDKRRTIIEKLVSLIRFSFEDDTVAALQTKVRHFYDLYYLAQDAECKAYLQTAAFPQDLAELFAHDQQEFDTPKGWIGKSVEDSLLVTDFPLLWKGLRFAYQRELQRVSGFSVLILPPKYHE
jgi:hypothetical protein